MLFSSYPCPFNLTWNLGWCIWARFHLILKRIKGVTKILVTFQRVFDKNSKIQIANLIKKKNRVSFGSASDGKRVKRPNKLHLQVPAESRAHSLTSFVLLMEVAPVYKVPQFVSPPATFLIWLLRFKFSEKTLPAFLSQSFSLRFSILSESVVAMVIEPRKLSIVFLSTTFFFFRI